MAPGRELAEFFRLCDEAGEGCPLAAPGGAAARYDALASGLREQPLAIDGHTTFGYDVLVEYSLQALYTPEYWGGPDGYAALFAALADAVLGDASATQRVVTARQAIRERLQQASSSSSDYDNGQDAFYGTLCADAGFPDTFRDYHRIGAWAERGSFLAPPFWWQNVPCAKWPASADRYVGPWTARTSAPV